MGAYSLNVRHNTPRRLRMMRINPAFCQRTRHSVARHARVIQIELRRDIIGTVSTVSLECGRVPRSHPASLMPRPPANRTNDRTSKRPGDDRPAATKGRGSKSRRGFSNRARFILTIFLCLHAASPSGSVPYGTSAVSPLEGQSGSFLCSRGCIESDYAAYAGRRGNRKNRGPSNGRYWLLHIVAVPDTPDNTRYSAIDPKSEYSVEINA